MDTDLQDRLVRIEGEHYKREAYAEDLWIKPEKDSKAEEEVSLGHEAVGARHAEGLLQHHPRWRLPDGRQHYTNLASFRSTAVQGYQGAPPNGLPGQRLCLDLRLPRRAGASEENSPSNPYLLSFVLLECPCEISNMATEEQKVLFDTYHHGGRSFTCLTRRQSAFEQGSTQPRPTHLAPFIYKSALTTPFFPHLHDITVLRIPAGVDLPINAAVMMESAARRFIPSMPGSSISGGRSNYDHSLDGSMYNLYRPSSQQCLQTVIMQQKPDLLSNYAVATNSWIFTGSYLVSAAVLSSLWTHVLFVHARAMTSLSLDSQVPQNGIYVTGGTEPLSWSDRLHFAKVLYLTSFHAIHNDIKMTNPTRTPDRNEAGGGGEHLDDAFRPSSMFEFAEFETLAMKPNIQQLTNTNRPGQFEPVGYRLASQRPFDYGAASKQLDPSNTHKQTERPEQVQDAEDEDADADHESITEEEWRAHEFQDQMTDVEDHTAGAHQGHEEQIEEPQLAAPDADSSGTQAQPTELSDDADSKQDDSELSDEEDPADKPTPAPSTQPASSKKRPRSPAPAIGGTYTYKGATYVIQGHEPDEWLRGQSTGHKRQKTSIAVAKNVPVPAKGVAYKKKKANKEEAEVEDDGDDESDEDFDPDAMDLDD
ncbi:hypothetical protein TI39_contig4202g00046 [Zymoseptoria brevis]|uniref:Uncharacterized protein n=1 Tax=Zymoseptoria brevis TaxID=1047168 RepID=A0A0F4GAB9_9PEZI|nr:hypothetical protein TI39_contig4202g00046 [Zymoseptoria brevis]